MRSTDLAGCACRVVLGVLLAVPWCARADEEPRHPVAITVSGGVTLGVYEAGYALMITQFLARQPERGQLVLATGASAGSANSLISVMNSCLPPVTNVEESLNWQVWIPFSFDAFFKEERASSQNMLSRAQMGAAMEHLWERWQEGFHETCDVVLAVSVTRVEPVEVKLHPDLSIPHQEVKFMLRIRGQGLGRMPLIENYPDRSDHLGQPLLHLLDQEQNPNAGRVNFEHLRDLIFASAAFPLAFAPQELKFCMSQPDQPGRPSETASTCREPTHSALFVDGGVFDNTPLRLAYRIAARGLILKPNGHWGWYDRGDLRRKDWTTPTFVYLNPGTLAYPTLEANTDEESEETLDFVSIMLGRFVASARSQELYSLVEEEMGLGAHLRMTRNTTPMISEHLGAFFGFFERDFRVFDFYLGMFDAFITQDGSFETFVEDDNHPSWAPLRCLVGWLQPGQEALRPYCQGPELENFRILLQVSIDRLASRCHAVEDPAALPSNTAQLCRRIAHGEPRPVVNGVKDLGPDALRRSDEDDFSHTMRLFTEYGYHFRDLGLDRSESRYGRVKIRRKILKMIKALADQQSDVLNRIAVLTAGRSMVNQIAYEPPRDFGYVAAGTTIEGGYSFLPFDWNESWARFHVAGQVRRLLSIATADPDSISIALLGGIELHALFLATPTIQPFMGVRAGYQFDSTDTFAFDPCTAGDAEFDQRLCSQFVVQNYYVIAVLERLRLQLTLDFYPIPRDFDTTGFFDLQFGVGYHFF